MATPAGAVAPYTQSSTQGSAVSTAPVTPTAVATPKTSAVSKVGEILKTLIHNSGAFLREADVDGAISAVESFVKELVPASEAPAVATGEARAPKEDVTTRTVPGSLPTAATAGATLDYTKLAQAILAEQQKLTTGGSSTS